MSDECDVVVGGGCFGRRAETECDEVVETSDTFACPDCDPAWVGGGGACATSPGPPAPLLLLLLLFLARSAFAVDVEHLQLLDGGPVPGVVDPTAPDPWTPRVTLGAGHMAHPVRVRSGDEVTALVTDLDTVEVSASLQVDEWFRAGVTVPGHRVRLDGDTLGGLGDIGVFLVAPLGEHTAALTTFEVPLASSPEFARQASGTIGLTTTRDVGFVTVAAQARARFQEPRELPGVRWGNRLEAAAGLRTRGRGGLGVATLLGAPLGLVLAPAAGAWPVEGLGFGSLRLAPGVHVEAGAGAGLTWGLGSPGWRAFGALRIEGHPGDRDGDGLGDLRDLCPSRPEDLDGFRDRDGCPELDNDRDGYVDLEDGCPNEAEVFNDLRDGDGCPDDLARWRVVVVPEDEAEQLRILVDGEGGWQLEPELDVVLHPGEHHLLVEAPGHRPFDAVLAVPEGRSEREIRLQALHVGKLRVTLVDPDGAPVAGQVVLGADVVDVPRGGTTATVASGAHYGTASAEGYLPETVRVLVPAREVTDVEVVLEPVPARVDKPPVLFGLDSAELAPRAVDLLDQLAAWLRAHPDVRLLRIEGHADAIGSPAYNYALSVRRASAVRDALVARGIEADRLDPVGSGEAVAHLVPEALPPAFSVDVAGVPARDVTFRVLVWDEAVALER